MKLKYLRYAMLFITCTPCFASTTGKSSQPQANRIFKKKSSFNEQSETTQKKSGQKNTSTPEAQTGTSSFSFLPNIFRKKNNTQPTGINEITTPTRSSTSRSSSPTTVSDLDLLSFTKSPSDKPQESQPKTLEQLKQAKNNSEKEYKAAQEKWTQETTLEGKMKADALRKQAFEKAMEAIKTYNQAFTKTQSKQQPTKSSSNKETDIVELNPQETTTPEVSPRVEAQAQKFAEKYKSAEKLKELKENSSGIFTKNDVQAIDHAIEILTKKPQTQVLTQTQSKLERKLYENPSKQSISQQVSEIITQIKNAMGLKPTSKQTAEVTKVMKEKASALPESPSKLAVKQFIQDCITAFKNLGKPKELKITVKVNQDGTITTTEPSLKAQSEGEPYKLKTETTTNAEGKIISSKKTLTDLQNVLISENITNAQGQIISSKTLSTSLGASYDVFNYEYNISGEKIGGTRTREFMDGTKETIPVDRNNKPIESTTQSSRSKPAPPKSVNPNKQNIEPTTQSNPQEPIIPSPTESTSPSTIKPKLTEQPLGKTTKEALETKSETKLTDEEQAKNKPLKLTLKTRSQNSDIIEQLDKKIAQKAKNMQEKWDSIAARSGIKVTINPGEHLGYLRQPESVEILGKSYNLKNNTLTKRSDGYYETVIPEGELKNVRILLDGNKQSIMIVYPDNMKTHLDGTQKDPQIKRREIESKDAYTDFYFETNEKGKSTPTLEIQHITKSIWADQPYTKEIYHKNIIDPQTGKKYYERTKYEDGSLEITYSDGSSRKINKDQSITDLDVQGKETHSPAPEKSASQILEEHFRKNGTNGVGAPELTETQKQKISSNRAKQDEAPPLTEAQQQKNQLKANLAKLNKKYNEQVIKNAKTKNLNFILNSDGYPEILILPDQQVILSPLKNEFGYKGSLSNGTTITMGTDIIIESYPKNSKITLDIDGNPKPINLIERSIYNKSGEKFIREVYEPVGKIPAAEIHRTPTYIEKNYLVDTKLSNELPSTWPDGTQKNINIVYEKIYTPESIRPSEKDIIPIKITGFSDGSYKETYLNGKIKNFRTSPRRFEYLL